MTVRSSAPLPFVASVTCTPSCGCVALPVSISSCAIRLAWSIGIAKPSPIEPDWLDRWLAPSEAIAELMPTTRPARSTSGPPELPGLIAASVWMASMTAAGCLRLPLLAAAVAVAGA